jgi:predicted O-methyltransferase YrrM
MVTAAARERPDVLADALGWAHARVASLDGVPRDAGELRSFEDVAPLVLTSSAADRGAASMRLDELAHLWRLARAAGPGTLVEIGRERGGSTLTLAAAVDPGGVVWSFDPQTKHGDGAMDDALRAALERYGLGDRVRLVAEDSHTAEPPPGEYALVLVDGDPTTHGARLDFERYCLRLRPAGRALFHDATAGAPRHAALAPLLAEIEARAEFRRLPDIGTFTDFVRVA